jgi:hypothetical protein
MNQIAKTDERVVAINNYLQLKKKSIFGDYTYSLCYCINKMYIRYDTLNTINGNSCYRYHENTHSLTSIADIFDGLRNYEIK